MYAGVDIGGTKVLAAVMDEHGQITKRTKFPTPQKYEDFLAELKKTFHDFHVPEFQAAGVGMPATSMDRAEGRGLTFGNLPWRNVPIQGDLEQLLRCPVAIENDAKLGALSEYMLVKDKFHKVLYVTISTGIGVGLVDNGHIDTEVGDAGGKIMYIEHNNKLVAWESLASGHAIVERFGKKAMDITDEATWKLIAHDISRGLIELVAITEPEVVVIGGSVGTYFDRYAKYLEAALKKFE
ncbi:MAG TPA: ROK family protein, partial [Candidatus Saccharimonadales bacterium]|nr:ROK family protein [Candidatus Saccharimonadales bacterium]